MTHRTSTSSHPNPCGDPGPIVEGWFIVKGGAKRGTVYLTDASGTVLGEGRPIERDPPTTARAMLRDKWLARRLNEPNHAPIRYPRMGRI